MSGEMRRIELLEKWREEQQKLSHEHDTAIKLNEQIVKTAVKEISGVSKGLSDLNKTVSDDVVPMMIAMTTAKETKNKLEAKIGKTVLGIVSIIAVTVSIWTAFFKGN